MDIGKAGPGAAFCFLFQCLDREVVSYGTVRIPFFFVKTSELHLILTKSVLGCDLLYFGSCLVVIIFFVGPV